MLVTLRAPGSALHPSLCCSVAIGECLSGGQRLRLDLRRNTDLDEISGRGLRILTLEFELLKSDLRMLGICTSHRERELSDFGRRA